MGTYILTVYRTINMTGTMKVRTFRSEAAALKDIMECAAMGIDCELFTAYVECPMIDGIVYIPEFVRQ